VRSGRLERLERGGRMDAVELERHVMIFVLSMCGLIIALD
jgi:hypothetical protein